MAKKEKEIKKSKDLAKKTDKGTKEKAKAKEVKAAKSKKEMSPLEKARLARAAGGKGGKAKAKKKNTLPTVKAPEEFKPHFVTVDMKSDKDGLLSNSIRMTRYQGRYDPEADDKKKFDVATYDQKTVQGVLARFAMTTYATNATKRLPTNTVYQALLRVNRKSADGSISVGFKSLSVLTKNKKGRMVLEPLDKKDPVYRKFRKASRILPFAFKEVLMPPKRVRGANKKAESDDE